MLTDALREALEKEGITLDEFRELAIRLLNYGVLTRAESLDMPEDERPGTEYFEKTDVFTIALVEKNGS